jgi:membrane dipeptidase
MPVAARQTPKVCDLHVDTMLEIHGGADLAAGNPEGHVDLARLRQGGAGLMLFACFVADASPADRAFAAVTNLLDELDHTCERLGRDLMKVETAADVERAWAAGRIGVMPAVENGYAIESKLANLETLRGRGVRYLTLTHIHHLPWAASSGDPWSAPHGLQPFGREVVAEMERLRILVDVSHVHETTFWDVQRLATKPFIATHSCAAALCPIARNLSDDQIRAIADSGGVIGVNFFPAFLDPTYLAHRGGSPEKFFAEMDEAERRHEDPRLRLAARHRMATKVRERFGPAQATADTLVAHIRHMTELVGVDHVALGSDFDGVSDLPADVPDCSAYPHVLERLAAAGFDEAAIAKIAGRNFLRVLAAVDRG